MWQQTIKTGLKVGLSTTWSLGKIIFPVTMIVAFLQHTPILPWVIELITPFMGVLGLSGDAAIPLVLGNFLNIYAAIGAIFTMELTVKEVFIIAVMLSFSHALIIESSVAVKVGVKLWIAVGVRLALAFISAVVINLVWKGGEQIAQYGLVSQQEETVTGLAGITLDALQKAGLGVFQLAVIVIPLMLVIQVLKDLKWLDTISRWMAPLIRKLGIQENTSTTLAAGLLFGLTFGAGVMIQAIKEDGVSKKDITLAFIFLITCHAVVEDTLIFIPLGIPILPLLLVRVFMAILITMVVAALWNRAELAKRKEATYEY
ncbi:nucleoside recognition domain-containing protein [Bacillus dakarensis]|uniref:nucleoside recognition domain-containing protein n=1 Tax=Robertmurraya dakarensis TaxID=1926278 RepID=UPI0009817C66|nr:nucleoside recognition domain-containing protein [Bacillus dakarensis]